MNMKSIFFIDPMSYGTIAQYDKGLLDGIRAELRDGENIVYLCSKFLPYTYQYPIKTVKIFNYNKLSNSFLKGLSYVWSYICIISILLVKRPKVIHIQWIRSPKLDYYILGCIQKLGIKVVYTVHNVIPHNNNNIKIKRSYRKYYIRVNQIIVHSEATRKELILDFNIDPCKINVVRHGILHIDVDKEKVFKEEEEILKTIDLKDKIVFSCLGQQSTYKGSDIIIDAWRTNKNLNSNPNLVLILAGNFKNVNPDTLATYENVYIEKGYISDERYMAYLNLSSATLLPYRQISQSGALLTALSAEVPVVVSDIGGLGDPLRVASIGWNIGQPNANNFSSTLINIISKPDELAAKKSNKKEWEKFFKMFSWKEIGKITKNIYDNQY